MMMFNIEVIQRALGFEQINSDEDLALALDLRRQIGSELEAIEGAHRPTIQAAHEAHKAGLALMNQFTEPFKQADQKIKDMIANYERARKIEQDRLAAELAEQMAASIAEQVENGREFLIVPVPQVQPAVKVPGANVIVATIIGPSVVPAYWNGEQIRLIDMAAINRIGRQTDGQAIIPGVRFDKEFQVRRK